MPLKWFLGRFKMTLSSTVKVLTGISSSKFFTYVTKTRPNLTTYSRKPGNYNGTIIFDIDIMKKSYPINLNLRFLPLSKPKPKHHLFSGTIS